VYRCVVEADDDDDVTQQSVTAASHHASDNYTQNHLSNTTQQRT